MLGLKDLDLANVAALIFGVTREFNYKDLMLCNILLANPDCLFLLDMPDETFKARTDSGTEVILPCNTTHTYKPCPAYSNLKIFC